MHLPNGSLNDLFASGMFGAAAGALGLAWSQARNSLLRRARAFRAAWAMNNGQRSGSFALPQSYRLTRRARAMFLVGSAVLLAQMVDFSLFGSGRGHLIGAAAAVIILGPAAAVLTMAAVVVVQATLLADGGLSVLGANVFNLAVVAPLAAHLIMRSAAARAAPRKYLVPAAALAGWASVVAAASAVAFGSVLFGGAVAGYGPELISAHILIGLAEAAVTVAAAYLARRTAIFTGSRKTFYDQ